MNYETMMMINSGLLTLLVILFGIVGWYFRKDWADSKTRITKVEDNVELIVREMKADRERERGQMEMMKSMITILARNTKTEIGL